MALNCEQCFAAITSADQFCPNCGTPRTPPAPANSPATPSSRCCSCTALLQAGDRFCPTCGATQPHPSPLPHQAASPPRQPPRSPVNACQRCGETFPGGNRFCIGCGAPAGGAASAPRPPQPATATASVHPKPTATPQPGNTTYQTPIQVGSGYLCPKCNAALTPGLKICQVCGVSFLDPVPQVRVPVAQHAAPQSNASLRGNGLMGFFGTVTVLVIGWGVFGLLGRNKGMSGVYTEGYGLSTITFDSNGHYLYRGPFNFEGDYDLQGSTLRLLPSSDVMNKMTPDERNNPLAQAMLNDWQNTFTTSVSQDKSAFSLAGVPYHRQ